MIETAEPQTTAVQTEIKTVADRFAPGWPGIPPRWTSSAKTGIGTALSEKSQVWFTLSHGILNEVYYPRPDNACIRDMGLIVTDGADLFSEEKRDTTSTVQWLALASATALFTGFLPFFYGKTLLRYHSSFLE